MTQGTHWHFLPADRRLRYGTREEVEVGKTIRVECHPILCESGLHASMRAIDALKYAPGPIICRVTLGGVIVEGDDKVAAQERTVVWMADATNTLHEFACRCAEDALRTTNVDDRRCWEAIETKRRWLRGEATDDQLEAARAAAWASARGAAREAAFDAALNAAWASACGAARNAALEAAFDAAWDAASDAAWVAARAVARAAQNTTLESMLYELQPVGAA